MSSSQMVHTSWSRMIFELDFWLEDASVDTMEEEVLGMTVSSSISSAVFDFFSAHFSSLVDKEESVRLSVLSAEFKLSVQS